LANSFDTGVWPQAGWSIAMSTTAGGHPVLQDRLAARHLLKHQLPAFGVQKPKECSNFSGRLGIY
jgi:hypothetical protein